MSHLFAACLTSSLPLTWAAPSVRLSREVYRQSRCKPQRGVSGSSGPGAPRLEAWWLWTWRSEEVWKKVINTQLWLSNSFSLTNIPVCIYFSLIQSSSSSYRGPPPPPCPASDWWPGWTPGSFGRRVRSPCRSYDQPRRGPHTCSDSGPGIGCPARRSDDQGWRSQSVGKKGQSVSPDSRFRASLLPWLNNRWRVHAILFICVSTGV